MTDYIYRIALIVPDEQHEAANRIAEAMGWGAGCYSVPLATDIAGPATHWGLSAVATQGFVGTLASAGAGMGPKGDAPADLAAVLPVLLKAVGPATAPAGAQFSALAQAAGLVRIEAEQPDP